MKENITGLSVVKDVQIKCSKCNAVLVNIVVSETNEQRVANGMAPMTTKYKVLNCVKSRCDGSSYFTKKIDGSTNIRPADDNHNLEVFDTDIDKDGVIISILKVTRR